MLLESSLRIGGKLLLTVVVQTNNCSPPAGRQKIGGFLRGLTSVAKVGDMSCQHASVEAKKRLLRANV